MNWETLIGRSGTPRSQVLRCFGPNRSHSRSSGQRSRADENPFRCRSRKSPRQERHQVNAAARTVACRATRRGCRSGTNRRLAADIGEKSRRRPLPNSLVEGCSIDRRLLPAVPGADAPIHAPASPCHGTFAEQLVDIGPSLRGEDFDGGVHAHANAPSCPGTPACASR